MTNAEFFKKHGYVKIENFIGQDVATLLYSYVLYEVKRLEFLESNYLIDKNKIDSDLWGRFGDQQSPDFCKYGDFLMDTLLDCSLKKVEEYTGKKLVSNYTYHRLYTTDSELTIHKDRPSCEISTTLCLGYNNQNLKDQNWNWPMYVSKDETNGKPVHMNPGDMIIYRGCELYHWREPFPGLNHAQVFLHYNEKDGEFNNINDGRPMLGLPKDLRKYYEDK